MKEITLEDVQKEISRQISRDYQQQKEKSDLMMMFAFGLAEEAGEVAGIYKRMIRNYSKDAERISREHLIEELGDVLWYLAAVCDSQDTSLAELWEYNIRKLEERYGK